MGPGCALRSEQSVKGTVREPEVETAAEAQMRLFLTMEGIYFELSVYLF